jgi:RNA polymerase sigma-70 factor (ECF subfamily)
MISNAVARAQVGDEEAFAELYSLHKYRVYKVCLRMVRNVALAEDLCQESFLQLFRKIATFKGNSAFSTWLHRLTVNVVLMHLRRKGLFLTSLEYVVPDTCEDLLQEIFGTTDPCLVGSVDRLAIDRAANTLPNGYQTVFYLHDVQGFHHHEIA